MPELSGIISPPDPVQFPDLYAHYYGSPLDWTRVSSQFDIILQRARIRDFHPGSCA